MRLQCDQTYTSATASTTATATSTATSGALRVAATLLAFTALGTLLGGTSRLRLAGELNRNLAIQDGLAVELIDGTLSLRGRGYVNEGVADWAGRAWVGGD